MNLLFIIVILIFILVFIFFEKSVQFENLADPVGKTKKENYTNEILNDQYET